jgi:hypothetical protein
MGPNIVYFDPPGAVAFVAFICGFCAALNNRSPALILRMLPIPVCFCCHGYLLFKETASLVSFPGRHYDA